MTGPAPSRDPRRSLLVGAVIAGAVLAAMAVMVSVGLYLVFSPRP